MARSFPFFSPAPLPFVAFSLSLEPQVNIGIVIYRTDPAYKPWAYTIQLRKGYKRDLTVYSSDAASG